LIPKRFTATNEKALHFEFESLARLPLAFLNARLMPLALESQFNLKEF
jgi:hypothetical protein